MSNDPSQRKTNDLARDVDRLLRQLPFGDPMLRGDATPAPQAIPVRRGPSAPAIRRQAEPSALAQRISAWLRALLAVTLAAAVTVWPYASNCGWMLYLALLVIGTVMVAGVWASVWTWRLRVPAAHVLSVGVIAWGLVLAAGQVLPRVGYAAVTAVWTCGPR